MIKSFLQALILATGCVGISGTVCAQQNQANAQGQQQERRLSQEERLQEQLRQLLRLPNDEWEILRSRIAKIQTLREQMSRVNETRLARPRNGQVPATIADVRPDSDDPPRGTANAVTLEHYIRVVELASKDPIPTAELKAALASFRAAKARSKAELEQAQAELRGLVTTAQEAILVVAGILE